METKNTEHSENQNLWKTENSNWSRFFFFALSSKKPEPQNSENQTIFLSQIALKLYKITSENRLSESYHKTKQANEKQIKFKHNYFSLILKQAFNKLSQLR